MTKEELRTSYLDKGWDVEPVSKWGVVSKIEGKTKYDLNVVSPNDKFGTVQAVVIADGEEGETARARGSWEENTEVTFKDGLNEWLESKEKREIYAIAVEELFEDQAIATLKVFVDSTIVEGEIVVERYVSKFRNANFTFKKIS